MALYIGDKVLLTDEELEKIAADEEAADMEAHGGTLYFKIENKR